MRMRVASASSAFSRSSLTTDAGRSTTSPAAILLATASERTWILPMMSDGPWVSLSDDNWEGKASSGKLSDDYAQDLASRLPETCWPSGGCGRAFARVPGGRHAGKRGPQNGDRPHPAAKP